MKLFNNSRKNVPITPALSTSGRRRNRPTYLTAPLNIESVDYSNYSNEDLRIGYFSSWGIACGIAVYTEHLVNALKHHGVNVFVYSKDMSVENLSSAIDRDRIHILNIQYEPAIVYSHDILFPLIEELRRRRIKVFLTFHSESVYTQRLIENSNGSIFHKEPSVTFSENKVHRVPMGVPVFSPSTKNLREKYGFSDNDIILSTTGFMFTWKRHAVILDKLASHLKRNPNYKVQLLTAFNTVNPQECIVEEKNIKSVIERYSLENQVTHKTSFLSQQELSERLYISDIGYLWGALTTSSSSAAGKEFITSRLPLVVTESNHYHDLTTGVIKTPINEDQFVSSIFSLQKEMLFFLKEQQQSNYDKLNNNVIILKHLEAFKK